MNVYPLSQNVVLDAAGDGIITFGPVPLGFTWKIQRMAVDSSAGTPDVTAYRNSVSPNNIVDFSDSLARNIADEAKSVHLESGETLVFQFDGGGAGATATAVIQLAEQTPEESAAEAAALAGLRAGTALVTLGIGDDDRPAW